MESKNKIELEKCLEAIEANLSHLQVSGYATIYMGDVFKLLIKAKELTKEEVKNDG